MAARQLQRLRARQDEEEREIEVLDEDEASPPTRTAPFNPFDLLDEEDEVLVLLYRPPYRSNKLIRSICALFLPTAKSDLAF